MTMTEAVMMMMMTMMMTCHFQKTMVDKQSYHDVDFIINELYFCQCQCPRNYTFSLYLICTIHITQSLQKLIYLHTLYHQNAYKI